MKSYNDVSIERLQIYRAISLVIRVLRNWINEIYIE